MNTAPASSPIAAAPALPPGRAGAPVRALILLGDGASASSLDTFQARHPDHEIWTMNAQRVPEATRHFDIHYDQADRGILDARAVALARGAEVVVSPFREAGPGERAFPLQLIFMIFGAAYYERTLCFMLALALHQRRMGCTSFDVLCLPGHDFAAWPHFAMRAGPSFWLGVAHGMDLSIEFAPGTGLLRRKMDVQRAPARMPNDIHCDEPHCYGQPRHVTEPHAMYFNWN